MLDWRKLEGNGKHGRQGSSEHEAHHRSKLLVASSIASNISRVLRVDRG